MVTSKVKKSKKSEKSQSKTPEKKIGLKKKKKEQLLFSLKSIGTVRFWQAAGFDLLAIIMLFGLYVYAASSLYSILEPILPSITQAASMKLINDPNYERVFMEMAPTVHAVLWQAFFMILAAYVCAVFIFTLLNGAAWNAFNARTNRLGYFNKMFAINLIWFSIWLFVLWMIIAKVNTFINFLVVILLVILFISDHVLRATADGTQKIFKLMGSSIKLALMRVHWFIFLLVSLWILTIAALFVIGLVSKALPWLGLALLGVLILLAVGFSRAYFCKLVGKLKE